MGIDDKFPTKVKNGKGLLLLYPDIDLKFAPLWSSFSSIYAAYFDFLIPC
jgi:hypothetical protein